MPTYEELLQENSELRQDNGELRQRVEEQERQIAHLKRRIVDLEKLVEELRRRGKRRLPPSRREIRARNPSLQGAKPGINMVSKRLELCPITSTKPSWWSARCIVSTVGVRSSAGRSSPVSDRSAADSAGDDGVHPPLWEVLGMWPGSCGASPAPDFPGVPGRQRATRSKRVGARRLAQQGRRLELRQDRRVAEGAGWTVCVALGPVPRAASHE